MDTGFTDTMIVDPDIVWALRLVPSHQQTYRLANGQRHLCTVYDAVVLWDGIARPFYVAALSTGNQAILGMEALQGLRLIVGVEPMGAVLIEKM